MKKLFKRKKTLSMPVPANLYKDLPEVFEQGEPFKENDQIGITSAIFVNVPGKNENQPGTIKILFKEGDIFYDLNNNRFSSLPKDWKIIHNYYYPNLTEIRKVITFCEDEEKVVSVATNFFSADKHMQTICAKYPIQPVYIFYGDSQFFPAAEMVISRRLCNRIKNHFLDLTQLNKLMNNEHFIEQVYKEQCCCKKSIKFARVCKELNNVGFFPTYSKWVTFERKCQQSYQELVVKATNYANQAPKREFDAPYSKDLADCYDMIRKGQGGRMVKSYLDSDYRFRFY